MSRRVSFVLALVLVALPTACAGGSPTQDVPSLDCTLVLLKTGPRKEPLTADERKQVFGGHFANMQRLAREGSLLVAGPFGKTKSDPALRGLSVLDTDDAGRARALAETDPGFAAGVFAFHFHALSTAARLREQLAAELAAEDAAAAAGSTPALGETMRSYVLLTADDGSAAMGALQGHAAVLMTARLDTTKALVLLDAVDIAAANKLLEPLVGRLGRFQLDEWGGSKLLMELPKRRPA